MTFMPPALLTLPEERADEGTDGAREGADGAAATAEGVLQQQQERPPLPLQRQHQVKARAHRGYSTLPPYTIVTEWGEGASGEVSGRNRLRARTYHNQAAHDSRVMTHEPCVRQHPRVGQPGKPGWQPCLRTVGKQSCCQVATADGDRCAGMPTVWGAVRGRKHYIASLASRRPGALGQGSPLPQGHGACTRWGGRPPHHTTPHHCTSGPPHVTTDGCAVPGLPPVQRVALASSPLVRVFVRLNYDSARHAVSSLAAHVTASARKMKTAWGQGQDPSPHESDRMVGAV